MSLITMIQEAAKRIGITAPLEVVGSADNQVIQLLALANEEGQELSERCRWQRLIKEATFNTVATASQGDINTIAPDGFLYVLNETIWNRDTRRPVFGPLSPRDWQMLQALPITGPFDQYRIRGNELLFDPVPAAGESCAFEYLSENFCESSDGTGQSTWQADDDVGRLSEKIMTQGLVWRWKSVKGYSYAEGYQQYELRVADAMARDGSKETLDMGGGIKGWQPGIWLPQGNWNA